jgi:nucleoside-diphosphate-sugar epimerase
MKVLITGGYGFIGSHVADRFHQEGYEVFIIDNLSTGKKEHITFKHKGYILSVEDQKCEEIFKSHKFDVVVHLAAQVSVAHSVSNPMKDAESNVVGLVNMLHLAANYNVKKFIYASSAAVYGLQTELPISEEAESDPISPYGISKVNGEVYCAKWQELYGLPTLGLRFSNVYGPRQDGLGEGGVISIFMNRMVMGQPFVVYGDGEQTRDFIYVEDVAYAIYRSANSPQTGIYNLSANKQTSVNRVIEIISGIQNGNEVTYVEKREGDIDHSVLDNRKVMRDFDWSPLYTIEEGLAKTAAYFIQQGAIRQTAATAISPTRKKAWQTFRLVLPTIENMIAFVLIAWLTHIYADSTYSMIDMKLFYITIIGVIYGSRQALLAVVFSSGLFVYQKLSIGRDIISLTYDTDVFFQIAIYLFVGLVVGYTIERKNTVIQQQDVKVTELTNRYEFLDSVYTDVREVKEELQHRILNSGDSYGKIYSATRELESLEPELVFTSAVKVVKSIMQAPKVMIYLVNPNETYLRLLASSGYHSNSIPKSLKVSDHEYVSATIQKGKLYTNKNLEEGVPLMVAPLFHNDRVTAIIAIDGLAFESFSLYHQNLFRITADLISSALSKAFTYIAATESQRYIERTVILKPEIFNEIVTSKRQAFEQYQVPYLLLQAELQDISYSDAAEYLSAKLRETDYIGFDDHDNLLVLFSNTSKEDGERIVKRLAHDAIIFTAVTKG